MDPQQQSSTYYDTQDSSVKTVPERCREYYQPEDFVQVQNIDTQPFTYVIQRPENVLIHQPTTVTSELYYKKDPDTITLEVGQTRLCPAYEADHIIKQLMDKIIISNRQKVIAKGETPKESAIDPAVQHFYIKKIFQGKRDFMSEYNKNLVSDEARREAMEKELEAESKLTLKEKELAEREAKLAEKERIMAEMGDVDVAKGPASGKPGQPSQQAA